MTDVPRPSQSSTRPPGHTNDEPNEQNALPEELAVGGTLPPDDASSDGTALAVTVDFSAAPHAPRPKGVSLPGYEIAGELGRGAMGVVYKARQVALDRWVALKMVLSGAHAGENQLARFAAEAKAVAALQHPNIVQIYEIGIHEGLPYFTLELVDGGTLSQKVHRQPQPPAQAAHLVETLARAIAYAHRHGVIHRDLKPGNVMLTGEGIPKIADFGLAKRLEDTSGQTKSGAVLGTPSYMAPEQARGESHAVGATVDVYALGAMLYELLTGRPPFEAATVMETMLAVTRDEPVPPSRLQPHTPRDLETICLKCLDKDPAKRYASAEALAEDLRRYLSGEPILARPISAPARLYRWCRRNPGIASLSAAVFLLLLVVSIVSVVSNFRIRHESQLKDENARLKEAEAERALKAEQQAQASAKTASEQRTLALNTLYSLITKVDDNLSHTEGMNDVRQDILKTAMDGLGKVSRTVENARMVDRSMGVALQRMAALHERLGNIREAIRLYKRSVQIFDRLETENPDDDWLRWDKAVAFDALGSLSNESEGDSVAAMDYYLKALAMRQQVVFHPRRADPPFSVKRPITLLISYLRLGDMCRRVGRPAQARDYLKQGMKQCEAILADDPKDAAAPYYRAHFQRSLGLAFAHFDVSRARAFLEQSVQWRRAELAAKPSSGVAKRELGSIYDAMGDVELEQNNGPSAIAHYAHSFSLYEGLHKGEPNNAEVTWYLAYAYYRLGRAYEAVGDRGVAVKEFTAAIKLREELAKNNPRDVQFQRELMLVRAHLGRYREATRTCAELRQRAPKNPQVLLDIARGYALSARALRSTAGPEKGEQIGRSRSYEASALEALRQAISFGYQDAVLLERDPDLAPIRANPEFKEILQAARAAAMDQPKS